MSLPLVYNIQKYSIYNGDGMRTTVFFKGCPLRCKWCDAPQAQQMRRELLYDEEKCVDCGQCVEYCPREAIQYNGEIKLDTEKCVGCGICSENCLYGARELAGIQFKVETLVDILSKDAMFYKESHGGITLSGGEVMLQNRDYIQKLVRELHERQYNIAITTCGAVAYERFKGILPYVDTFLFDIKTMNKEKHKQFTGVSNELILHNLVKLSKDKAAIMLRFPLIRFVNDSIEDFQLFFAFVKKYKIQYKAVELLPYQKVEDEKYIRLGRIYEGHLYEPPTKHELQNIKTLFEVNGIKNVIIR